MLCVLGWLRLRSGDAYVKACSLAPLPVAFPPSFLPSACLDAVCCFSPSHLPQTVFPHACSVELLVASLYNVLPWNSQSHSDNTHTRVPYISGQFHSFSYCSCLPEHIHYVSFIQRRWTKVSCCCLQVTVIFWSVLKVLNGSCGESSVFVLLKSHHHDR